MTPTAAVVQDRGVPTPLERFAAAATTGEPLEVAALALGAHARGDADDGAVDRGTSVLDALAVGLEPALPALEERLFADFGLHGDADDYDAPENSFVDDVLERRRGLPITLAVVAMAVGRRAGIVLSPVAMPGHFLVRHEGQPRVLLDCFGGRRLTSGDCAAIVNGIHGREVDFDLAWLDPVHDLVVLHRMAANLAASARRRGDGGLFARVVQLHGVLRSLG